MGIQPGEERGEVKKVASMIRSNRIFFEIAKNVSRLSDYKKTRLGAVVVDGKRILSTGYNSNKTNPTQARYNQYREIDVTFPAKVHAEVSALNSLIGKKDIDFHNLKLFVYRELKDGSIAMARPCPSCMALIKDLGIKKIYYTTPDGYVEEDIRDITR